MAAITTPIIFQLALEFWGVVFCLIASGCILVMRPTNPKYNSRKLSMQFLCIFLLINDALSYIFLGRPGTTAHYISRFSNFFVYFTNYIYMTYFANFMWRSCSPDTEKPPKRLIAVYVISTIAILLLIISQFNGMFYYFDDQNNYYRGDFYICTQLIGIVGLLISFSILMEYRKTTERLVFFAMLSYFVLPALATVFQMFYYGMSLQNLSFVFSTQLIWAVDMIKLSRQLDSSKTAFLAANKAAQHDSMTGLYNKASGMAIIKQNLSEMTPADRASLIFMDIDDFKHINDTYGHTVGDFWITEIAKILLQNCRKDEDVVCRFGGDEYLVFLKKVNDPDVLLTRIRDFKSELQKRSQEMHQDVHCSMGICRINAPGQQLALCIDFADRALYEAKRNGKNTFFIKDCP